MIAPVATADPRLDVIATVLPPTKYTTEEMLWSARGRLSERLEQMLSSLGVQTRYSVLANYTDVLFRDAEPKLAISATDMAVRSVRECVEKGGVDPAEIGLVIGVTSSPGRLLPSMVCDLIARVPEIPRTVPNLALEYMGCPSIAKVLDTARWFLSTRPDQRVLVCFMEAITPLTPALPGFRKHFSEIAPDERQSTVDAMHAFLFGDATVSMVLSAEGTGPSFGPAVHLTNELLDDAELGTVPDGGSDIPLVDGRRLYTLGPAVTRRGTHYALSTIETLLAREDSGIATPGEADTLLLHTGATRILDKLCDTYGVPKDDERVASSYHVLRDHGNTIGCSVPLMLSENVHRPEGKALVMAFGLSFSCGAFTMRMPSGGWSPEA